MSDDHKDLDRKLFIGMLEDFAKNWLAHDGLWFQEVEKEVGMDKAIAMDKKAWESFSALEAMRIMQRHKIPSNSGLDGLKEALKYRMYAFINKQTIRNETDTSFEFYMSDCRVQAARNRKGMPLFPCKDVGIVEYTVFARTIDKRITCECICAPPDKEAGKEFYCGWKFTLNE